MPVLEEARRLGFLGPGPVKAHLDHAAGFAEAIVEAFGATPDAGDVGGGVSPRHAADLGSGAGVPALPLALRFPACTWALVEAAVRRAAFLREAVARLDLTDRVEVVEDRAEAVSRSPAYRGRFDLVVARSFGPPALVAECGAPLLRPGGRAVVSEPPGGSPSRWPAAGLAVLGMRPGRVLAAHGATYQVLHQDHRCPDRYPRRVGIPGKRPLF